MRYIGYNKARTVVRLPLQHPLGIYFELNYSLISLDVISLCTNIPIDLTIKEIMERWDSSSNNIKIPREEFLIAIRFILNSIVFSFKNF